VPASPTPNSGRPRRTTPAVVAEQDVEALLSGKDHVVAGSVKNKLTAASAKVTPEAAKAALHRKMSEPGSAEES
jgi:hypothetical protein